MNEKPRIEGVGVIFYPELSLGDGKKVRHARDAAREIAKSVRQGSIIGLPSTRDENGNLLWDFKIVEGDPGQVEVRRIDADKPCIVEG